MTIEQQWEEAFVLYPASDAAALERLSAKLGIAGATTLRDLRLACAEVAIEDAAEAGVASALQNKSLESLDRAAEDVAAATRRTSKKEVAAEETDSETDAEASASPTSISESSNAASADRPGRKVERLREIREARRMARRAEPRKTKVVRDKKKAARAHPCAPVQSSHGEATSRHRGDEDDETHVTEAEWREFWSQSRVRDPRRLVDLCARASRSYELVVPRELEVSVDDDAVRITGLLLPCRADQARLLDMTKRVPRARRPATIRDLGSDYFGVVDYHFQLPHDALAGRAKIFAERTSEGLVWKMTIPRYQPPPRPTRSHRPGFGGFCHPISASGAFGFPSTGYW